MTFEIAFVLVTLGVIILLLASNRLPPDIIMMGGMLAVLLGGIITPEKALIGFANPGLMTVAILYVLAAALRDTGAIYWISNKLLGLPQTYRGSLVRLIMPTGLLSAFLNNTTVVSMMIPAVQEWAGRLRIPASKLLLPLSYAAILGGTCTLIGTSTNLVVNGLMLDRGMAGFNIFDVTWVGLPLLIIGSLFMTLLGRYLLPDREGLVQQMENAREYNVDMHLPPSSPLHGKTIEQAGLRNLVYGYLTDVHRNGQLFTAVGPDMLLQEGDRLSFIGAPECARELQRINGLEAAHGDAYKLNLAKQQRSLVEVVVGADFPSLGQTVKQSEFRTRYQAAILSISRGGRRIAGKVGDIEFNSGDTLLLEAGNSFVEQYRYRRDFLLVSPLQDSAPISFDKAPLAVGILLAMVVSNVLGLLSIFQAALTAAALLILCRCVTISRARQNISINLPVLVVIGASFALAGAIEQSGAATWIVQNLFGSLQGSPWLALLGIYVMTVIFTELITNNAAAVLVFPIALNVAHQLGVNPIPFIVVVMFAASASFLTPIGYQTNTMVMGPGGYRFTDYIRFGLPMTLVAAAVTLTLVPFVWHF